MLTIAQLHAADGLEKKIRTELAETGGTWWGPGADHLGLATGDPVDTGAFLDLYTEFRDSRAWHLPAQQRPTLGTRPGRYLTPADHRRRLQAEYPDLPDKQLTARARKMTRSPLLCVDLTFALPKSVSVLHAAFQAAADHTTGRGALEEAFTWHRRAAAVREAVMAGNTAMLETVHDLAGTVRAGAGGKATMEANGWVVARFPRSWNRARDPFLYVRNLILNRVERADGKWRTLDSRKINHARAWGAAVGERVASEALVASLGVDFVPHPGEAGFEVAEIPAPVLELFSVRNEQVREATPALMPLSRTRATRYPAMLTSLAADKEHAHRVPGELVHWWDQRLKEADLPALADIASLALRSLAPQSLPSGAVRTAQHRVTADLGLKMPTSTRQRGWVALQINNRLPGSLGGLDSARVRALLAEAVATYQP